MAELAHTITATTSSVLYTAPTARESTVRIQNLDDVTTGSDIWINVNGSYGGSASVEGAECIRIKPSESYEARGSSGYYIIAVSGTPKVLMESSNGR